MNRLSFELNSINKNISQGSDSVKTEYKVERVSLQFNSLQSFVLEKKKKKNLAQ